MDSFGAYDVSVRWIAAVSLSGLRVYVGTEETLGEVKAVMAESYVGSFRGEDLDSLEGERKGEGKPKVSSVGWFLAIYFCHFVQ